MRSVSVPLVCRFRAFPSNEGPSSIDKCCLCAWKCTFFQGVLHKPLCISITRHNAHLDSAPAQPCRCQGWYCVSRPGSTSAPAALGSLRYPRTPADPNEARLCTILCAMPSQVTTVPPHQAHPTPPIPCACAGPGAGSIGLLHRPQPYGSLSAPTASTLMVRCVLAGNVHSKHQALIQRPLHPRSVQWPPHHPPRIRGSMVEHS